MKESPRRKKSKLYLWFGLALLGVGSILLLCCKIVLSAWGQSALLFSGGGSLLLGNGFMLYGLLHHADDRVYAHEDEKARDLVLTQSGPLAEATPPCSTALAPAPVSTQVKAQSTAAKA